MKNEKKFRTYLILSVLVFVTALSVAAYSGLFSKENPRKVFPSGIKTTGKTSGGPIHFTTKLDNKFYYDNQSVYLYVNLKADKVGTDRERTPLNVAVVIDKSGSMSEKNKLEYVKKSVSYIIDQLNPDDYVSVVTYDDYVNVLQRSATVRDKYDLREMVSKIQPGGYTNLSDGMFEGYDQVNKSYSRGYVNRVLLLSDGLANRGITDRFRLADLVRDKNRRDGITISTFGVGNDFNENLMADIADYGKGNYYYISNSADIPDIFAQELRGIQNLVGQGCKMKVSFPERYLRVNKVFGYPYDVNGNEVTVDFKDIFSEQDRTILIKFDVVRKIDSRLDFDSELSYEDIGDNFKMQRETSQNSLDITSSKEEYTKNSDEKVTQSISVFESNDIMENALREADNGNYGKAKELLNDGKAYMEQQMNTVQPSPEMRRQQESMDKYDKDLNSAETKTEDEKKEMQKSGKYDNYNSRKNK